MMIPGSRWLAACLVLASSGVMAQPPLKTPSRKPAGAHPGGSMGRLKPVDINHATQEEISFMLKIDVAVAAKIVAGRPYPTKARLLSRKIVSPELYEAIRDRIVARQDTPGTPAARSGKSKKQ